MVNTQGFINFLLQLFPTAKCELNFQSTFELLIAVILSAQCTDARVNKVTQKLFAHYKTSQDFANARVQDIEKIIKPCGLYKSKAMHIKQCCKRLVDSFDGKVPNTHADLTSLSGVGNKTASVVLATAFGQNTIAVDTHVLRVSRRLGFTKSKSPDICQKDLTNLFKSNLGTLHHRMVLFGRYFCKAINPKCDVCELKNQCQNYKKKQSQKKN